MPKAIKKRVKKKNIDATADVASRLSDIKDTLRQKQKTFLTYVIAAVVIVLAVAGTFLYRYSTDEKARRMEYEGYKMYYGEYAKIPLSNQERYQKALDLFKQANGVRKSARALLYIANCDYELGRYDEALTTLSDFIKQYADDRDLLPLAYEKSAAIQMKKGNAQEALKTLDTLSRLPGSLYKDTALFESAGILESEGRKDEALAKYREIVEKYKDSPYYEAAKAKSAGTAEKKEG
jgi:predicted negative regulator of RcsB-dependent stress response